jgi:hypothetical protein
MVVSVFGAGIAGSAAATNHSQNSTQVDVSLSNIEGNGTAENPYILTNASELQAIEDDTSAHYRLGNDIDASGTVDWNSGSGFRPINRFNGTLNGSGYSIRGLYIDQSDFSGAGLINVMEGNGRILKVHLQNVTVIGTNNVGGLVAGGNAGTVRNSSVNGDITGNGTFIGGLVALNSGVISSSNVSGTVVGQGGVGGLVGDNENGGTIQNSYTTADIEAENGGVGGLAFSNGGVITNSAAVGNVNISSMDGSQAGGLVGSNGKTDTSGIITASYAAGTVQGKDFIGGLVGRNVNGSIERSYSVSKVEGRTTGGLTSDSDGTVTGSYWDTQATGQPTSAGSATGLSTAQMTGEAARTNMGELDFNNTWTVTESYPELRSLPELPDQDNGLSVASIIAPPDASYSPTEPFMIGTTHNATGTIGSGDVAIRLVNVTDDNETVVALSDAAPVAGQVNTTIPAGSLSGNVTIETQLYDLSAQRVVATDTLNLTANTADGEDGIVSQYDVDGDGLETSELLTGIGDWRGGEIETRDLLTLIDAWRSNSSG